MALKFSTDGATLNKYIKGIKLRSGKLIDDIHNVAVMCAVHAVQHNNYTPIINLVDAVGKGMRANSLRKWMIEFAPVKWGDVETTTDDGKTKTVKGFVYNKTKAEAIKAKYGTDMDALAKDLNEATFVEFDPEPEFKSFDLDKAIASLLKRAEGIAEDDSKKSKSNLAHFAALKTFATQNGIAVN